MKVILKKYLLALTFLVSFFALSGYVSHSTSSGNRISDTELFSNKNSFAKGGISYKRTALNYANISFRQTAEYSNQKIVIDNRLISVRYQHLKNSFVSFKNTTAYPIDHLYYTAVLYSNATSC